MLHILQDYIASGCTLTLTGEQQAYYELLYTVVGLQHQYGRAAAINALCAAPFNFTRRRARQAYEDAVNLFYLNDGVERAAKRALLYERLTDAADEIWHNHHTAADLKVMGMLLKHAAHIATLDRPDTDDDESNRPAEGTLLLKTYELTPEAVGLRAADRNLLARQIDSIEGLTAADRRRLRVDAGIDPLHIEDLLTHDPTEETEI
jgi:hypothetical protein